MIVFGSFARGAAGRDSDLDAVFVRSDAVDEDDHRWAASVEHWLATVKAMTGNPVEVLEVASCEVQLASPAANRFGSTFDVMAGWCTANPSTSSRVRRSPKPPRTRTVSAAQVRAYAGRPTSARRGGERGCPRPLHRCDQPGDPCGDQRCGRSVRCASRPPGSG